MVLLFALPSQAQHTLRISNDGLCTTTYWGGGPDSDRHCFGNAPLWGESWLCSEVTASAAFATITAAGSQDIPLPAMSYGSDGAPVPISDMFFTVTATDLCSLGGHLSVLMTYTAGSPTLTVETEFWPAGSMMFLKINAFALRPEAPVAVREINGIGEVKSMYEE